MLSNDCSCFHIMHRSFTINFLSLKKKQDRREIDNDPALMRSSISTSAANNAVYRYVPQMLNDGQPDGRNDGEQ